MLQEVQQQMFGFSGLGILFIGLVIITILLVIGLRENEDIVRKARFIRSAGIISGVLIIIMELLWCMTWVVATIAPMTFEDVLIITAMSSIGGLIIGVSCYYPIKR